MAIGRPQWPPRYPRKYWQFLAAPPKRFESCQNEGAPTPQTTHLPLLLPLPRCRLLPLPLLLPLPRCRLLPLPRCRLLPLPPAAKNALTIHYLPEAPPHPPAPSI